jgi:thiamine pyrophosphokinase
MNNQSLLVILNGTPQPALLKSIDQQPDRLVELCPQQAIFPGGLSLMAADGGANSLQNTGLIPDWIVGDLDSISRKTQNSFNELGCKIIHLADQNSNDLEKCLDIAATQKINHIWISGFEGDRADMLLGLFSLLRASKMDPIPRLIGSRQIVFPLLPGRWDFKCRPGEMFSLVHLEDSDISCNLTGLRWGKTEQVIPAGFQSVSNISTSSRVTISFDQGILFVFRNHGL